METIFLVKAEASGDLEVQHVVRGFADPDQASQFSAACQAINDELQEKAEDLPYDEQMKLKNVLDPRWNCNDFYDYSVISVPFGAFKIE